MMGAIAAPMNLALDTFPEPSADPACVGWWHADDYNPSTGNWLDRVSGILGNQSTASKRPTTTTIQTTTWVAFDGVNDSLYLDGLTAFDLWIAAPTTVIMLAVLRTPTANSHLWSAGDGTDADNARQLRWNDTASGTLRTVWSDRAANVTAYDHNLADQQNFHTIAVVDVTGIGVDPKQRTVYCDGVPFASDPRVDTNDLDTLTTFTLGANRRFGTEGDYGSFDLREISFHKDALTATAVRLAGAGMRARARLSPTA